MVTHTGGCHCGRVRFEVQAPARFEVKDCNCSMCAKSGYLHLMVPKERFKLLAGGDVLTTYEFNTKTAKHRFCSVCGIKSFASGTGKDGVETRAINVRCLDDVDLQSVPTRQVDGKSR